LLYAPLFRATATIDPPNGTLHPRDTASVSGANVA